MNFFGLHIFLIKYLKFNFKLYNQFKDLLTSNKKLNE